MANYFGVINRTERILGRPVTSAFSDLINEFQLNIKTLVNQVNKDVLLAFTYQCRERETTISIAAELSAEYSSITNTIPGEIETLYDTTNGANYIYNDRKSEFILGKGWTYDYGFRNNQILFDADDEARTLTVEYHTNKLALDAVPYENFEEGVTVEKDQLTLETDFSILPSFLHEPILAYGACYYFELQKNESRKVNAFKAQFDAGIRQLNAHNRSEDQGYELRIGDIGRDLRRSAVSSAGRYRYPDRYYH